jgi:DNA-binding transcriptional ArsR family regulator
VTAPALEPPGRAEIIAILAALGHRAAEDVTERIGSLELAWLVSQVEQRYATVLELSDETVEQMATVTGAVATLRELLAGAGDG